MRGIFDIANKPLGVSLIDTHNATCLSILQRAYEILEEFQPFGTKSLYVDNKVLVICLQEDIQSIKISDFSIYLINNGFEVFVECIENLLEVKGSLGNFYTRFLREDKEEILNFSQAVLFVEQKELEKFNGFFSVGHYTSAKDLLEALQKNTGEISYQDRISFSPSLCQYQDRREKCCTKCAQVCPTFGVVNDDSLMQLRFSQIDCVSCGACVGVCPTGVLDLVAYPKEALNEIVALYASVPIFLCDFEGLEVLESLSFKLPSNVAPLVVPSLKILNENDALGILQESGHSVMVFRGEAVDSLNFVNNIYEARYQQSGFIFAKNPQEIIDYSLEIKDFPTFHYMPRVEKSYRESFSQRLSAVIKDGDYGRVENRNFIRYGVVKVESNKCTMCLSCVGACNTNALFPKESDYSLRFNPSLCTTCGYCASSCPENILQVELSGIALNESFYKSSMLAKDAPFNCIECHKPFATKSSIEKIKKMLSPAFMGDAKKLRTLECCADCKVKVMFGSLADENKLFRPTRDLSMPYNGPKEQGGSYGS